LLLPAASKDALSLTYFISHFVKRPHEVQQASNWKSTGELRRAVWPVPGANGYANSFDTLPQFDVKADPPYSALIYQTPSPLTGSPLAPDLRFPSVDGKLALASKPELALPLIPYDLTNYKINADAFTGDIVHRFYHQQLQIDNEALSRSTVARRYPPTQSQVCS
jgi:hypothetical protein